MPKPRAPDLALLASLMACGGASGAHDGTDAGGTGRDSSGDGRGLCEGCDSSSGVSGYHDIAGPSFWSSYTRPSGRAFAGGVIKGAGKARDAAAARTLVT